MIEIITKYQEVVENIPKLINESKFRKEYIISSLNLSRSTFYNKLNKKSFTPEELMTLGKLLFPMEANDYELKKSIEKGLQDIESGNTRSHKKVMADFRKHYAK